MRRGGRVIKKTRTTPYKLINFVDNNMLKMTRSDKIQEEIKRGGDYSVVIHL